MKIQIVNKRLPVALAATRSVEAITSIPRDVFQTHEAISTLGVMNVLELKPALVIADLESLEECPQVSRHALRTALDSLGKDGAVMVSSFQFTAEPDRWIGEALLVRGLRSGVRYLPPRIVLVTNFCGGVGKTTLSLAMARRFRQASGLATAIVEVGVGGSSLNARLPGEYFSLYEVVTQAAEPGRWEDVTIYPSDNWEAGSLAADERTPGMLRRITQDHTLTVFDAFPTNPLWGRVLELASDIMVIAAPRQDSLAQTDAILRKLKDDIAALEPQPHIHMVLNQVRTLGERLPLAGQISAWIGYDEHKAECLDSTLAEPLLNLVYPGWAKRKKRKASSGRGETGEGRGETGIESKEATG